MYYKEIKHMIYLKNYNKDSDYLAYRDGDSYGKPNVSYSIDSKAVHYNYPPIDTNGFDFVNLELPSGTLWAACNVGASTPTDYGLYFQWGDTSGYTAEQIGKDKTFTEDDYKWLSGGTYTKYNGYGDTLELEDDAAYAYMGGDWHMPTYDQLIELRDNTTVKWETINGISGQRLTSKIDTSKSLFFPASGYVYGQLNNLNVSGTIWSCDSKPNYSYLAYHIFFENTSFAFGGRGRRFTGANIRGVIG